MINNLPKLKNQLTQLVYIMKKNKVIIGLSGGVDSAVAAHLLIEEGYDVSGVYMQNWEVDNDDPYCSAEQDLSDAKAVSDHLGIDFHVINFSREYWDKVFSYCLNEFSAGRTPNPDIWCNKEIKFNVFLKHALQLGADYLATGHYAKIITKPSQVEMHKAADVNKDQTYFLYTLNQQQLSKSLFPLSNLTKPRVREIAHQLQLPNSNKKDSTGICFIGERKFKDFLKEFILGKPGDIITDSGQLIGKHDGLMYYTLGQRKGLDIGGIKNKAESPWYVIEKDVTQNQLIVGQGHDHPGLLSTYVHCDNPHWINTQPHHLPLTCSAKTRYRQEDQPCTITKASDNEVTVEFRTPQRAVTPGQSIVFYDNDHCLGGATIVNTFNK